MSRLIDADVFKAYMQDKYVLFDNTLADIDAQPTVDAVEVIRCKECIHSVMTTNGEVKYCKKHDPLCRNKLYYDADFFCADGDRKGVMK